MAYRFLDEYEQEFGLRWFFKLHIHPNACYNYLRKAEEVKIYAKLPKGFQIPTPVGNYSPDWAIVFREGSVKHVYFIAETKGSMSSLDLRPIEKAKISCAKRLFEKLSNGSVHYDHVDSYEELQKMLSC